MTKREAIQTWKEYLTKTQWKIDGILKKMEQMPAIKVSEDKVICSRCHCEDRDQYASLTYRQEKIFFCCSCLQMGRITSRDILYYLPNTKYLVTDQYHSFLSWKGELSLQQKIAAQEAFDSLGDSLHPHLIHAVTGAGKTEMLFPIIDKILRGGGKIAIASPRVDVCIELFPRICEAFKNTKVILLHGKSQTQYKPCDILITTTHQLLRFIQAFDLLIVDEVDAFPYVDDHRLHFAVNRAVKNKGKLLFLTATPDKKIDIAVKKGLIHRTILPARYHGHPLVEPIFIWLGEWETHLIIRKKKTKLFNTLKNFIELKGKKLIFMANIKLAIALAEWLMKEFAQIPLTYVYAADPERQKKVEKLRRGEYEVLISTTILERGVTFENCQVYILGAEDPLFSKSALVQMSGRVGRKADFPSGKVIFGHHGITSEMKKAYQEIRSMNLLAKKRGLLSGEE
ncbi:DEAD/DEAH box helicase [Facklamia miroungae]|nr:DEAD/DEAH box helicase [Facklamia miroungae]NKZ29655.1 DEAD/DEAH box helicase [Facklamia miroungae]